MVKNSVSNREIRFKFRVNNKVYEKIFNQNYIDEFCEIKQIIHHESNTTKLSLSIIPHTEILIEALEIKLDYTFNQDDLIYVNGYQSWTDSKEFFIDDKMNHLSKLATPLLNHYQFDKYGDYTFKKYSRLAGDFHGYTYGYIRNGKILNLIASLTEKNGYTIINTSTSKHRIVIEKECKNLTIDSEYQAFDLLFMTGEENEVFDTYFNMMKIDKPKALPMTGWTSWYNYYQNINEEIILKNVYALKKANKNIDIIQVDDGYQENIGDWLDINPNKFPNGMKVIADKIHQSGYKAGIWLAPFVCETNSTIFKEHNDWILRNKNGELVLAGSNWSRFYALNLELVEVKQYLRKVFEIVLNEWGFDLVKLDFLYAVCIESQSNKTRGQIMCEAMEFLRECVNDKLILACGVPLGPSFGLVDYCRIGCDVGLDWDDKFYMHFFHRERVSTLNAINNSMSRRHLNERAFLNDPDVFFLRDENVQLSKTQKETLAFVNKHFGSLIFTSDDISLYTNQDVLFDQTMTKDKTSIIEFTPKRNGVIELKYNYNSRNYLAYINLSSKQQSNLEAYETKVVEIKEEVYGSLKIDI